MSYTALIIDDDEITRILLLKYSTKIGFEAESVSSSSEAIEYLQRKEYQVDFVLCDLFLPDSSGLELLKKVKSQNPLIDFVLITGHASIDSTIEAIREGASDYVFKPVNYDEFAVRMNALAEKRELKLQLMNAEKKLMYQATVTTANHEINQPLTVIISGIDLLRMELKKLNISSPVIENYLQLMYDSSQRIAKILKRFREISHPSVKSIPRGMKLIELSKTKNEKLLQKMHILVIEDEKNILNIITKLLTQWGARVDKVEFGWDAIRKLQEGGQYDLILMDLNLPDIDYIKLFNEIKKIVPNTKVMIMSGYATEKEIQFLMDQGAEDFIMKPFSAQTLQSKIMNMFNRQLK